MCSKGKQNTKNGLVLTIEQALERAIINHHAGNLQEAERFYRAVLVNCPSYGVGWKMLGAALLQLGRSADALEPLMKATALLPRDPEAHNNLGTALRALGELEESAESYRQALALDQSYAEPHSNLGVVLKDLGRLEESVASYRRALELNPNSAEAHSNMGVTLKELGWLNEAEWSFRRALEIKPAFAEVFSNLGMILFDLGRLADAENSCRQALNIKPNLPEALCNLGVILTHLGRHDEAEAMLRRALELTPYSCAALNSLALLLNAQGKSMQALNAIQQSLQIEETNSAKTIYASCISQLHFINHDGFIRSFIVQALKEPWGRPSELARIAIDFIRSNPDIDERVDRAAGAWPRRLPMRELFGPRVLPLLHEDALLHALLESSPICDVEFERFLTMARKNVLETAIGSCAENSSDAILSLACSLARQCFINEYVFSYTKEENIDACDLRDRLVVALENGTYFPSLWPIVVAAYFPLYSVKNARKLLDTQWSSEVSALLEQQITEPASEAQIHATIPRLTNIEDEVSLLVKDQYEKNPYPRWVKMARGAKPIAIGSYLRRKFPLASFKWADKREATDILVAGCGTGQHPVSTAQLFQNARILAIDLSIASLSYAKRKTLELGIDSIEYAQADLLKLGTINRSFDIIESSGVLHHLADPWSGWRMLISLLRPDGLMKLGLYSEIARRNVVKAQTFTAEYHCGSLEAEDIRHCRQGLIDLVRSKSQDFGVTLNRPDFFSISTCRDLLFHVQEHRFSLTDIEAFLKENNLKFLGFDIQGDVLHAYKHRFPNDLAAVNLAQWQVFEYENPNIFVGMYQFWIQTE